MAEENKSKINVDKKDAVAYLKGLGIKKVSDQTFINRDNLEALLNKDFETLTKTKVLGFIQILEREFGINLQEFKNEYLQATQSKKKSKKVHVEPIPDLTQDVKPQKILRYVLLGLVALAGAYYLFSGDKTVQAVKNHDLNVVKNDVVVAEAKESLLTLDVGDELNDSEEVDLNKVVEEMFKNSDFNESDELNTTENAVLEDVLTAEENVSNSPIMTAMTPVETKTIKSIQEAAQTVPAIATKAPVKKVTKRKVVNAHKEGLFISPTQKAWVGVVYLDSMKKKDYLIRDALTLDANKDQIILVGHKNFKIYNHGLQQHFQSRKMVRFVYRDGDLREISKQEYLDLLGSMRW